MTTPTRPLLAATLAAALLLAGPTVGAAEGLSVKVERETFFQDEGRWFVGLRPALGYDLRNRDIFPRLDLSFGYAFPGHLYVGGRVVGRLTAPFHTGAGLRTGVIFQNLTLALATGVDLGFLAILDDPRVGLVPNWWLDVRFRLAEHHYLSLSAEFDILFDALGFADDRALFTGGLGWTVAF